MAKITNQDIRERLEALLGVCPVVTTVITDDTIALAQTDLPAAIVLGVRSTRRQKLASESSKRVTETWEIGYLERKIGTWTAAERRQYLLEAEAAKENLPDFFDTLDRLALPFDAGDPTSGKALKGIKEVGDMTDEGLESRPFGEDGAEFYSFTYSLPITYSH